MASSLAPGKRGFPAGRQAGLLANTGASEAARHCEADIEKARLGKMVLAEAISPGMASSLAPEKRGFSPRNDVRPGSGARHCQAGAQRRHGATLW
jgi:hypothetical protein